MLAAFGHEEPDRVPINIHVATPGEGYLYGAGFPEWRNIFDALESFVEWDLDPTVDIWLPDPVPARDVTVRDGRYKGAQGESILFKEYETPKGPARMEVRETEDWRSVDHTKHWQPHPWGNDERGDWEVDLFDDWNPSRFVQPLVANEEDLEKLPYLLNAPDGFDLEDWRRAARHLKAFATKHDLVLRARRSFAADAVLWLCDTREFLMATVEDPDFCRRFLRIVQDWSLKTLELALDIGVDIADRRGWYEVPNIFGGRVWEEMIAPMINEAGSMVHETGALHCYQHTEGNLAMAELIKGAEIDVIWGVDPTMGGDTLGPLKEAYRGEVALMGGISDCQTLQQESPAAIREEVREVMSIMAPGGGFAIMPVHCIMPDTPWAGLEAFIKAAKEFGRYDS